MRSGFRQLVQDVTYKGGQVVADSANAIIPHRTGAVDVMVVEQPDGSIRASAFYVRFGKYAALVGNKEVNIQVNGHRLDFTMTLERYGTAYFCKEIPAMQEDDDEYDDANLTGMMSPCSGYSSGDDSPFNQMLVPTALRSQNSVKQQERAHLEREKIQKSVRRTVSSIETQWSTTLPLSQLKFSRSDSFPAHSRVRSLDGNMQLLEDPLERVRPKSAREFQEHLHRVNTGLSDKSEEEDKLQSRKCISASPSFQQLQQLQTQRKKVFSSAPYLGLSPPISPRCSERLSLDFKLNNVKDDGKSHVRFEDSVKKVGATETKAATFQGFQSLAGSTDDTSQIQFQKVPQSGVSVDTLVQPPKQQHNQNGCLQDNKNNQESSEKQMNEEYPQMQNSVFDKSQNEEEDEAQLEYEQQGSENEEVIDSRVVTQLSLCWRELVEISKFQSEDGDADKQQLSAQDISCAVLKIFEAKLVEQRDFLDNMQQIIQDANVAVRIGQHIYQFKDVLPVLVAASIFGMDPDKALHSIDNQNLQCFEISSEGQTSTLKLEDRTLSWTSYILSFLKKKDKSSGDERPRRKVVFPTEEQLQQFNLYLHEGSNRLEYIHSTETISCHVYKLKWDQKLVVSDVDGTITISDVLGHVLPAIGWDWFQPGICQLFTNIRSNGYHMMYLSSRAIAQALQTREMLYSIEQDGKKIPQGPVVISPEGILPSLYREVIQRRPHEFKIKALMGIRRLFPEDVNPFFAGFGNRDTDERSYAEVGIPPSMIFTINPKGHIKRVQQNDPNETLNLTVLNQSVEDQFPYLESNIMQDIPTDHNYMSHPRISLDNPSDVFEEVIEDEEEMEVVVTPYSPM